MRRRADRRRAPRRSSELVHELIDHRAAAREKVRAAPLRLSDRPQISGGEVTELREMLFAAEVALHELARKTLEWAQVVQTEMAQLRLWRAMPGHGSRRRRPRAAGHQPRSRAVSRHRDDQGRPARLLHA